MARIDWIEHRLLNWARWKLGANGGGLGYARVNFMALDGSRDTSAEPRIPINDVEASDTDTAVQRLPGELRATVLEVYTGRGGEADHLRRLHCAKATMHARIGRAHKLLCDHFTAIKERQDTERRRVESLTEGGRPRGEF